MRCFQNVAAHLADGGAFVVEAFVPQSANFTGGLKVTADDLVDYVERLIRQYTAAKNDGETFAQWAHRAEEGALK